MSVRDIKDHMFKMIWKRFMQNLFNVLQNFYITHAYCLNAVKVYCVFQASLLYNPPRVLLEDKGFLIALGLWVSQILSAKLCPFHCSSKNFPECFCGAGGSAGDICTPSLFFAMALCTGVQVSRRYCLRDSLKLRTSLHDLRVTKESLALVDMEGNLAVVISPHFKHRFYFLTP